MTAWESSQIVCGVEMPGAVVVVVVSVVVAVVVEVDETAWSVSVLRGVLVVGGGLPLGEAQLVPLAS